MKRLRMIVLFGFCVFCGLFVWLQHFQWQQIEAFLNAIPYRCPLKAMTGLKCAFCGMTHAWLALFRGEWLRSFHENALGIPFLIFMVFSHLGLIQVTRLRIVAVIIIFTAYALIRNFI